MPRRNHRYQAPSRNARRGGQTKAPAPRPELKDLVIPLGKCYRASRHGKLRFAKADAPEALKQAKAKREREGSAYHEERAYECKTEDGGCGDWHLTSRKTWEKR